MNPFSSTRFETAFIRITFGMLGIAVAVQVLRPLFTHLFGSLN